MTHVVEKQTALDQPDAAPQTTGALRLRDSALKILPLSPSIPANIQPNPSQSKPIKPKTAKRLASVISVCSCANPFPASRTFPVKIDAAAELFQAAPEPLGTIK
jgi:hypothetical protein